MKKSKRAGADDISWPEIEDGEEVNKSDRKKTRF